MARSSIKTKRLPRIPAYCHHRGSGQAYVKRHGKVTYLGLYGSEASREAYGKVVTQILADSDTKPEEVIALKNQSASQASQLTVKQICQMYLQHAESYYMKAGKKTSEIAIIRSACKYAVELFGDHLASSFGPLVLKALQTHLVSVGLSRTTINGHIKRIQRAFKWAAGEELISATVHQALSTVPGLRAGRTEARESKPILPVDDKTIEQTISHLPEVIGDMVRLQRLTGMRPGEVCSLRPCDVDRSGDVWIYRPASHKNEHHGSARIVFLGPKAQQILIRYLVRDQKECCFRPCDSEEIRRALQHAARRTPLSCGSKPGSNALTSPRNKPGKHYSTNGYRQAIHRACDKAGIDRWSPNQLRHTAATEVRAKFGLEAAQVHLGHSGAAVTQIYAERDMSKAAKIAKQIG